MERSPSWEANRSSASQIPTFYGTWTFITTFTRAHHVSQPCTTSIQSISPIPGLEDIFEYYPPIYAWGKSSLGFSHQSPVCTSPRPHTCYMPCLSHYSWFDHLNNVWWGGQIIKLLCISKFVIFLNAKDSLGQSFNTFICSFWHIVLLCKLLWYMEHNNTTIMVAKLIS